MSGWERRFVGGEVVLSYLSNNGIRRGALYRAGDVPTDQNGDEAAIRGVWRKQGRRLVVRECLEWTMRQR